MNEHARALAQECLRRVHRSESRAERAAAELSKRLNLREREFSCRDERKEFLVDLAQDARREFGLDELQEGYLMDLLDDVLAKAKED